MPGAERREQLTPGPADYGYKMTAKNGCQDLGDVDAGTKSVLHAPCRNLQRERVAALSVDITVNWNFIRDGENAQVTYATPQAAPAESDEGQPAEEFPFLDSVLPLESSVLAPGLSMPVPAG